MEGVHDRLAFVMEHHKEDPGETEEEDQAVEDEEGGESGSFGLPRWPIEPENLGENNKGNGAIAGIK
jgi:hypothetical protein